MGLHDCIYIFLFKNGEVEAIPAFPPLLPLQCEQVMLVQVAEIHHINRGSNHSNIVHFQSLSAHINNQDMSYYSSAHQNQCLPIR